MTRWIDLDQLLQYPIRRGSKYCDEDRAHPYFLHGVESVLEWAQKLPTLTPPNEPMLERVAKEYLEICGEDCAGDHSVGVSECPFFQYADVLDNGKLIQPKCELAAYCRPPEGEEDHDGHNQID